MNHTYVAVNLIKKREHQLGVLRGDTVLYVNSEDLRRALEYDLEQEKNFSYKGLSMDDIVVHVAKFVSGIWQIHPFSEGNTRTTAVFTIKYLRSIGFDVNNDLFADNSWYFRNALVRTNYKNVRKGIESDMSFLILFFRNLMMGESHELKNRTMIINAPQQLTEQTNRTSTEHANRTTQCTTFSNRKSNWNRTMFIERNNGENRIKASSYFHNELFDACYSRRICYPPLS